MPCTVVQFRDYAARRARPSEEPLPEPSNTAEVVPLIDARINRAFAQGLLDEPTAEPWDDWDPWP